MNKREKKLLNCFRQMNGEAQTSLQDFAMFLAERYPAESSVPETPLDIQRPEEESVIAAVKRLSATYPMLNKDSMLHETSALVAQHMIQGRDAVEVINELEDIFRRMYESYSGSNKDN